MATSTERRNVILTFLVAAATVIAVLVVIAGPATLECAGTSDMGSCLRDRVAGIGLLPGAPAEPAPAATPAPATQPEPPIVAETPQGPALELLRAEPDGSVIVAGTGAPGAEVAVYANGELFGTATAEPGGDWALVPDAPLPPGGTEITVGEAGAEERAERAFVVVIDPERIAEAKVIPTTPAAAAAVMREAIAIPVAEPAAPEPEVAASEEPAAAVDAPETPVADAAPAADDAAAVEPEPAPEPELQVAAVADRAREEANLAVEAAFAAAPPAEVASAPEPAEPAAAQPGLQVAAVEDRARAEVTRALEEAVITTPVPDLEVAAVDERARQEVALAVEEARIAPVPDVAAAAEPEAGTPAIVPGVPVAAEDMAVAAVEPEATATPESEVALVPLTAPTIDAIEIDGSANFFAGAGEEGAIIRLFVEDEFVGDSKVEGGRWLVEATGMLTRPNQRIRAEMSRKGSEAAVATAEVNFVVDLPETAGQPEVAETPASDDGVAARARREVEVAMAEVAAASPVTEIAAEPEAAAVPALAAAVADHARTEAATAIAEAVAKPAAQVAAAPEPPAPVAEPATAPVLQVAAASDRARDEVGAAITVAAQAEPETEMAAAPEPVVTTPPLQVAAVAERAREEVLAALAAPREIQAPVAAAAVPVMAEPVPLVAAETPLPALSIPSVAARARTEVALALAAPVTVQPPLAVMPEPEVAAIEEPPAPAAAEPPAEVASAPAAEEPAEQAEPAATADVAAAPQVERPSAEAAVEPSEPEVAAVEAPADAEIPTLRGEPLGDPEMMRFASGKVIIRRGDTLWDIARRVYGSGVEYRRIYQANRNVIRIPRLIYPGQVFDLPESPESDN